MFYCTITIDYFLSRGRFGRLSDMDKQTESGELHLSADHQSVVETLLRSGTSSHALHLALVFIFVQLYNFSGIKTVRQTHSFSLLIVCLFPLSETRNILGSKHSHKEMKGFGNNAKGNILFFKNKASHSQC